MDVSLVADLAEEGELACAE